MFKKVLIANRGEIALRVIRACRELGIETVAVYSEADRESLARALRRRRRLHRPGAGRQSYLRIPSIIAAAEITGADAIHPGYGFLAENAEFADTCRASNITFIGPTGEQIRQMGDKATRAPTGAGGRRPDGPRLARCDRGRRTRRSTSRESIGFPVIIKADGRRRRQGHADRAATPSSSPSVRAGADRGRWRRSATARSTWRSTCSGRVTSRSRSSATSTGRWCTSASATARCSGGTRS